MLPMTKERDVKGSDQKTVRSYFVPPHIRGTIQQIPQKTVLVWDEWAVLPYLDYLWKNQRYLLSFSHSEEMTKERIASLRKIGSHGLAAFLMEILISINAYTSDVGQGPTRLLFEQKELERSRILAEKTIAKGGRVRKSFGIHRQRCKKARDTFFRKKRPVVRPIFMAEWLRASYKMFHKMEAALRRAERQKNVSRMEELAQGFFDVLQYAPLGSMVQVNALRNLAKAYDAGNKQKAIGEVDGYIFRSPVEIVESFDVLFPGNGAILNEVIRSDTHEKFADIVRDGCLRWGDARSYSLVEKMRQHVSPQESKELLKKARHMRLVFDTDRKLSRRQQFIEDYTSVSRVHLRDHKDPTVPTEQKFIAGNQEAKRLGIDHLEIGLPYKNFGEVNRMRRDEQWYWGTAAKQPQDDAPFYKRSARTIRKARRKKREKALLKIKDLQNDKKWRINQLRLKERRKHE